MYKGYWVQQTPEEGRRTYRPKRCRKNNKYGDNSPKTLKSSSFVSEIQTTIHIYIYIYIYMGDNF